MRRKHEHPDLADVQLTDVTAALSDPIRVGLMRVLSDGVERGWSALQVPVGKSTQSHHLSVLRAAGLIRTREEGTRCYVVARSAEMEQRFPALLGSVLAAAGRDDVGADVSIKETATRSG
ncbi:ArsR/SmtB family transcription factor [Streptomyces sp. NPDC002574]|uniref:ArsR/SmtB family transcription factor n=1 Tax=Streptomyces sp. NPDC002574 TaxID=3364652 RepID=UPI00367D51E8